MEMLYAGVRDTKAARETMDAFTFYVSFPEKAEMIPALSNNALAFQNKKSMFHRNRGEQTMRDWRKLPMSGPLC